MCLLVSPSPPPPIWLLVLLPPSLFPSLACPSISHLLLLSGSLSASSPVSGSYPCLPLVFPPPTPQGSDTSCEITWMGSNCHVPPILYPLLPERFMAPTPHPLHSPQPWASTFHYLVIIFGPWHFPQPPPSAQQAVGSGGRKGKGLLLGPDARTWTLPLYPPFFPSSRSTAGKTPACSRGRQPRTVGTDINQTPRSPSPTLLSLQPSFQFLPVSLASRNLGSVPLTGTPSSTTRHCVWSKGGIQLMLCA